MSYYRLGLVFALAAVASFIAVDSAAARRYHRYHHYHYRVVHHGVHTFVFGSPGAAAVTEDAGRLAGYMLPGFIGATTADPYEHPSYGYYVDGGQGPGYSYYGD